MEFMAVFCISGICVPSEQARMNAVIAAVA